MGTPGRASIWREVRYCLERLGGHAISGHSLSDAASGLMALIVSIYRKVSPSRKKPINCHCAAADKAKTLDLSRKRRIGKSLLPTSHTLQSALSLLCPSPIPLTKTQEKHSLLYKTRCVATGKPKLLLCTACKHTNYCSTECQKADWKGHKRMCKEIVQLRNSGNSWLAE